jgi:hypothetical protein
LHWLGGRIGFQVWHNGTALLGLPMVYYALAAVVALRRAKRREGHPHDEA